MVSGLEQTTVNTGPSSDKTGDVCAGAKCDCSAGHRLRSVVLMTIKLHCYLNGVTRVLSEVSAGSPLSGGLSTDRASSTSSPCVAVVPELYTCPSGCHSGALTPGVMLTVADVASQ